MNAHIQQNVMGRGARRKLDYRCKPRWLGHSLHWRRQELAGNTAFVKPLEVGGSHHWGKGSSQGTGKIFLCSSLCFR